jgi:hypothetical protein
MIGEYNQALFMFLFNSSFSVNIYISSLFIFLCCCIDLFVRIKEQKKSNLPFIEICKIHKNDKF